MKEKWERIEEQLDYAFQPIVNIHTGTVFGFEALLRNWREAGFPSIQGLFDAAYEEQQLYALDLRLRARALEKFLKTGLHGTAKIFYNLDNRLLTMPDYSPGNTARLMDEKRLPYSSLCFEVSERHEIECYDKPTEVLEAYKQQHFRIAIDDFGSGYSGLQLLYHSEPDMVKLDRFFIDTIGTDLKKKLFVSHIVNMAHIMGIIVIAEGVETEKEFYVCREIGCDFVQGYLVQRPVTDIGELKGKYGEIEELVRKDKRYRETSQELIYRQMENMEPLRIDEPMLTALECFRNNKNLSFVPVVNENNEPLGILREQDLKQYVYSPFGISLLKNHAYGSNMFTFLSKIPVAEIHTRVEKILELYAVEKKAEAVMITENGKYLGVLNSRSLLQVLNEKELAEARDQNPLSKLPGNNVINEFIAENLSRFDRQTVFVYFDFNNFKPFNDTYGFRQGDRVILLFSDLLRETGRRRGWFVGHIGGDDFFVGISGGGQEWEDILDQIREVNRRFSEDVESFYSREDRDRGYVFSRSRDGKQKKFPLLGVSAIVVCFKQGASMISIDDLSRIIAQLKPLAKTAPDGISALCLNGEQCFPETVPSG